MSESYEFGQVILYEDPNFKGISLGFGEIGYGYEGNIPSQLLNKVSSLKIGPETVVVFGSRDGTTTRFVNETNDVKKISSIVGDPGRFNMLIVVPIYKKTVEGFGYRCDYHNMIIILILFIIILIYLKNHNFI